MNVRPTTLTLTPAPDATYIHIGAYLNPGVIHSCGPALGGQWTTSAQAYDGTGPCTTR